MPNTKEILALARKANEGDTKEIIGPSGIPYKFKALSNADMTMLAAASDGLGNYNQKDLKDNVKMGDNVHVVITVLVDAVKEPLIVRKENGLYFKADETEPVPREDVDVLFKETQDMMKEYVEKQSITEEGKETIEKIPGEPSG